MIYPIRVIEVDSDDDTKMLETKQKYQIALVNNPTLIYFSILAPHLKFIYYSF